MSTRRQFLARGTSVLLLASTSLAGCKRAATREEVLSAIAEGVALPAMRQLAEVDRRLLRAVLALPATAGVHELAEARKALALATLAWERAYVFRSGPLVESNAFLRAKFWPVRKSSLHELLLGEGAIDAGSVAALGVDVKGVYALERLLWETSPTEPAKGVLFASRPERARSLSLALAKDVQLRADTALKALGDGRAFVRSFAQGGQQSVALLVTQLVESVEAIMTDRLERVLGLHGNGRLKPGELLGDFSGLSTQLTCVALREVRALYLGVREDGLTLLVKQAAPSIDTHLRSALNEALRATEAIGAPLEQAVLRDASKIERARDRVKALELAFKVELPSALSVTLSIAAGDGD